MLGPPPIDRMRIAHGIGATERRIRGRRQTPQRKILSASCHLSALFFLSHVFFPFFSSKTVIIYLLCSAPQAQAAGPAPKKF